MLDERLIGIDLERKTDERMGFILLDVIIIMPN